MFNFEGNRIFEQTAPRVFIQYFRYLFFSHHAFCNRRTAGERIFYVARRNPGGRRYGDFDIEFDDVHDFNRNPGTAFDCAESGGFFHIQPAGQSVHRNRVCRADGAGIDFPFDFEKGKLDF